MSSYNILNQNWKLVLDVNAVIHGLISLFYEPNQNDPLNIEASNLLRNNANEFKRIVAHTLSGQYYGGHFFERFV